MKLEGPSWNEASNKVQKATKETKFLPGLLEDQEKAEKALRNAEKLVTDKEAEITETEAKTVETNNQLTANRETLSKTMDQITAIDKQVDGNKNTIASNTERIGNIDDQIAQIEQGIGDGSPEQFEAVSGPDNTVTLWEAALNQIAALKAEKAKLVQQNAILAAENDRLAKEKIPLVATRDNLQNIIIPPLEEALKQLTALHEKQVNERWPLVTNKNKKASENAEIQAEIKEQEQLVAQMDQDAVQRIQQYEEHVAMEAKPDANFFEQFNGSAWA